MSSKEDPRNKELETKFSLPKSWYQEEGDPLGASGMFLGGLIMVTRNRFLGWPALLLSIESLINQHPMRTKENSASSPWMSVMICAFGLIASYLPFFIVTVPNPSQTPLS